MFDTRVKIVFDSPLIITRCLFRRGVARSGEKKWYVSTLGITCDITSNKLVLRFGFLYCLTCICLSAHSSQAETSSLVA
jgi:hypothetical protein